MELNKLRPKLLEKLKGKQFIEDVSLENSITIIEPNNKEDDKLKEVKINNFDLFVSGKKAWRINLESSTVDGLQSSNKTTETALIFVKDNGIDVYLIEMKSMIVLDKIKDIKRKLQDTISRCYFLFILNSDESHNSY